MSKVPARRELRMSATELDYLRLQAIIHQQAALNSPLQHVRQMHEQAATRYEEMAEKERLKVRG